MASTYAGVWRGGPESFLGLTGGAFGPLVGLLIAVYPEGSGTLATLYSSRTKAVTVTNPLTADARGQVNIFAEPGHYTVTTDLGSISITILADPFEPPPPATIDESDIVHKSGTETVTGAKNFTGGLTKSGVAVETTTGAQSKVDTETARAEGVEALLIPLTQKGAASGVATLDSGGQLTSAQIPALALSDTFTVVSQAAMLALTAQRGDFAIRIDLSPAGVFVLSTDNPGTLADWKQITAPGAVVSVDGLTGVVVLPVDAAAGTGSKRTLGTGATQATAGNDARLSDARTPTAHVHPESDVTSLVTDLAAKLAKASNLSDLANAGTARTNLGLGTAAVKDVPSSGDAAAGQAVLGNDTRLTNARTPSAHVHPESDVTSLVADLASKAQGLTPTAVKTGPYTAAAGDLVPVDTTSGAVTITLPNAPADKTIVGVIHVIQGSTNAVTVARSGTDVLNKTGGVTTSTLPLLGEYKKYQYRATGGLWYVDGPPISQFDLRYDAAGAAAAATGTALQKASNLSDLANAGTARTNLGLGTAAVQNTGFFDLAGAAAAAQAASQPLDSDLTTIAGLTATTDSFLQSKSNAWSARTVAQVKTDLGLGGANSGDVSLAAVGAAPNANGASLAGQALTLQPADGTHPGVVSEIAQTFGGLKTLASGLIVAGGSFQVDSAGRATVASSAGATDRLLGVANASAHPGTTAFLYGVVCNPTFPATTTGTAAAYYAQPRSASTAFTMGEAVGFWAIGPTVGAGSTMSQASGFHSLNQGAAGITNAYGLVVDAQSGAATLNVAARLDGGTQANLWLDSDTATEAGGVAFSASRDTSLFRSAAGVLSVGGAAGAGAGTVLTSTRSMGHLMAMGV